MSDEIKKTVLNTLAEPIANSAKNITDKPTQNIGTTLADIWYLVFGGISQAADKRKLKYSYALQEFENELKENISKIPENQLTEPDMQIVAPALEASKYCIEKAELRKMFSKLIASSLDIESGYIHPMFIYSLSHLNSLDAKLLNHLSLEKLIVSLSPPKLIDNSIKILQSLNLIDLTIPAQIPINITHPYFENIIEVDNIETCNRYLKNNHPIMNIIADTTNKMFNMRYSNYEKDMNNKYERCYTIVHHAKLTSYGTSFLNVCSLPLKQKSGFYQFME